METEYKTTVRFKNTGFPLVELNTMGSYVPSPLNGCLQLRSSDGKFYSFNWDDVLFVVVEKV